MERFQIRDDRFGLAIYEAATARDALVDFCADRARAAVRGEIQTDDDGRATVTVDGQTFHAVAAG
jgi:hypothetical protein